MSFSELVTSIARCIKRVSVGPLSIMLLSMAVLCTGCAPMPPQRTYMPPGMMSVSMMPGPDGNMVISLTRDLGVPSLALKPTYFTDSLTLGNLQINKHVLWSTPSEKYARINDMVLLNDNTALLIGEVGTDSSSEDIIIANLDLSDLSMSKIRLVGGLGTDRARSLEATKSGEYFLAGGLTTATSDACNPAIIILDNRGEILSQMRDTSELGAGYFTNLVQHETSQYFGIGVLCDDCGATGASSGLVAAIDTSGTIRGGANLGGPLNLLDVAVSPEKIWAVGAANHFDPVSGLGLILSYKRDSLDSGNTATFVRKMIPAELTSIVGLSDTSMLVAGTINKVSNGFVYEDNYLYFGLLNNRGAIDREWIIKTPKYVKNVDILPGPEPDTRLITYNDGACLLTLSDGSLQFFAYPAEFEAESVFPIVQNRYLMVGKSTKEGEEDKVSIIQATLLIE